MSVYRPFEPNSCLHGSDLSTLLDWLAEHVPADLILAGTYRVGDLVKDIDDILDGMWSDGIDAMGEDA